MTDPDLRSRIGELIYADGNDITWPRALQAADLIIWELGLKRQDGFTTFDMRDGHHPDVYRYVSEWWRRND